MPIQFDSLFRVETPSEESAIGHFLSNPIYTALCISVTLILILGIFFPLAKPSAKNYFKIFVYFGAASTFLVMTHDSILHKSVADSFKATETPVEARDKIEVQPLAIGGEAEEVDKIIKNLENEVNEEN